MELYSRKLTNDINDSSRKYATYVKLSSLVRCNTQWFLVTGEYFKSKCE